MSESDIAIRKVANVIKALKGGVDFYQQAQKKINSNRITNVFSRIIIEKQRAIVDLQPFVVLETGDVETETSFVIDVRSFYASVLSVFSADTEQTYLSELTEVENKVLRDISEALELNQTLGCGLELRRVQARMKICLDEIKALQVMNT